jgi:hypothetical protein
MDSIPVWDIGLEWEIVPRMGIGYGMGFVPVVP